jgi:hypothetical protein
MFHSSTIVLDPSITELTLTGVSPFQLTIDPRNADPGLKTYKIVYNYDDDTSQVTRTLGAVPTKKDDTLKYPYEIQDPRNFVQEHTVVLSKTVSKTFNVSVRVYSVLDKAIGSGEVPNYTEYKIALKLNAPILDTASIATSGYYFEEIHLVNTRMFGTDNTILYNFESENPHYLLPTVVKWKKQNTIEIIPELFNPDYNYTYSYPVGKYYGVTSQNSVQVIQNSRTPGITISTI